MYRVSNGDWQLFVSGIGLGTIYGYKLKGPNNVDSVIVADPYSKAAITQNSWRHVAKSLVIDNNFAWEGYIWLNLDYNDLIIYETHVRDMTRHLSSEVMFPGT